MGGFCSWTFNGSPGAAIKTKHLSFDFNFTVSPDLDSGLNIIEDFELMIFKFLFFNWWFVANIDSSLPLRIFLMKVI